MIIAATHDIQVGTLICNILAMNRAIGSLDKFFTKGRKGIVGMELQNWSRIFVKKTGPQRKEPKSSTTGTAAGFGEFLRKGVLMLCIAVFLLSAWQISKTLVGYRKSAAVYKDIHEIYYSEDTGIQPTESINQNDPEALAEQKPMVTTSSVSSENNTNRPSGSASDDAAASPLRTPAPAAAPAKTKKARQTFQKLQELNSDIIGWIKIPNTPIDYPVLQGKDNDYYLTHNAIKKEDHSASIFMDYRNNIDKPSFNTIIYGHNMKDGSMFAYLSEYKREAFFNAHPFVYFDTTATKGIWEVFSIYVTNTGFDYLKTSLPKIEDRQNFIVAIRTNSIYKRQISVTPNDHILTLSTCSYGFKNARMVVHAKLVTQTN